MLITSDYVRTVRQFVWILGAVLSVALYFLLRAYTSLDNRQVFTFAYTSLFVTPLILSVVFASIENRVRSLPNERRPMETRR